MLLESYLKIHIHLDYGVMILGQISVFSLQRREVDYLCVNFENFQIPQILLNNLYLLLKNKSICTSALAWGPMVLKQENMPGLEMVTSPYFRLVFLLC